MCVCVCRSELSHLPCDMWTRTSVNAHKKHTWFIREYVCVCVCVCIKRSHFVSFFPDWIHCLNRYS